MRINVIPLIDIFAILMIVFIIATPTVLSNLKINLPKIISNTEIEPISNPLVFSIDKQGQYFLNDIQINSNNIEYVINVNTGKKDVYVVADRDTPYAFVANLIAILQNKGYIDINLATDRLQQ